MNSIASMENTSAAPIQRKPVRFNARSFVAFALAPEAPLREWLEDLDQWTENSPGFFAGRPVVLNLNQLYADVDEVKDLIQRLAERGIRVFAIESNGVDNLGPDLPPLLSGAKELTISEKPAQRDEQAERPAEAEAPAAPNTLILDAPIRSGQSIFHPHGDVIVMGSVGSGSEIIAGGSVHIYGALRGRAFAGALGNTDARIFCQKNEAELLAVDGWYRTADDMEAVLAWRAGAGLSR